MELTAEALEAHRRKERRAFGRTPEEQEELAQAQEKLRELQRREAQRLERLLTPEAGGQDLIGR